MGATFFSLPTEPVIHNASGRQSRSEFADLRDLANRMVRSETGAFSHVPAGYTYLGQFVSHDIVPETNPTPSSRKVQPRLQLDSLYGEKGNRQYSATSGLFECGEDNWDLLRDNGVARLVEQRNDENRVIAQFHRLWQRVHNQLIVRACATSGEEARELTVLLFQLVVFEDYLSRILDRLVYRVYYENPGRYLYLDEDSIPPEFSHAAFRFGHSMIRSRYRLNDGVQPHGPQHHGLDELFAENQSIPSEYAIGWEHFFEWNATPQAANRINTAITPGMGAVSVDIAHRNLVAADLAEVPTGVEYFKRVGRLSRNGRPVLDQLCIRYIGDLDVRWLNRRVRDLPLWPYLLLEAEAHQFGDRLGSLGSAIVVETIQNTIRKASPSIFQGGRYAMGEVLGRMGRLGDWLRRRVHPASTNGPDHGQDQCGQRVHMGHVLDFVFQTGE